MSPELARLQTGERIRERRWDRRHIALVRAVPINGDDAGHRTIPAKIKGIRFQAGVSTNGDETREGSPEVGVVGPWQVGQTV
jgi:hypothetical protein